MSTFASANDVARYSVKGVSEVENIKLAAILERAGFVFTEGVTLSSDEREYDYVLCFRHSLNNRVRAEIVWRDEEGGRPEINFGALCVTGFPYAVMEVNSLCFHKINHRNVEIITKFMHDSLKLHSFPAELGDS